MWSSFSILIAIIFALFTDGFLYGMNKRNVTLGFLLRDRTILATGIIVGLGAWCWSVLESLYPAHLERSINASSSSIGLIFNTCSLIYGFSCPLVGHISDRYGTWRIMIGGLLGMALILPFFTIPRTTVGAGVLLALMSVAYGFAMNPSLSELSSAVDRRGCNAYASVYAIYNIVYSIGMVGSDVSAGLLTSVFSLQTALLFVGSFMLCGLLVTYFLCLRPIPFSAQRVP